MKKIIGVSEKQAAFAESVRAEFIDGCRGLAARYAAAWSPQLRDMAKGFADAAEKAGELTDARFWLDKVRPHMRNAFGQAAENVLGAQ